ncbi:MAG TPA: serine/threonine-protein kinase [Polyangia bacterium]|jgi:serine/threonine protein kinase
MVAAAAKVARYRLEEPLGEGGQGCTWRARDLEAGRAVAVKVVELGRGGWKRFDLFERECQVLRGLSHPGIPRYLDTFAVEEQGKFFLVMELVEGVPLGRLLADRQLDSEAQLWNILHQALDILAYLHDRRPPVIHRDVKPQNLIRRTDGRLALVDFGGVRVALRPEGGSTVVGTFGYMAPEQLHGEATAATDVYGLAATIAALAAGREADQLPHKGLKIELDGVMPPSALRDLLGRMLEPDPEKRLGSVDAVRAALRASPAVSRAPADEETAEPDPVDAEPLLWADMPPPLRAIMRVLGTLGYVGLVLLDYVVLPMVFVILNAAWSNEPDRVRRLRERRQDVRRALRGGRKALRQLTTDRAPPGRRLKGRGPRP